MTTRTIAEHPTVIRYLEALRWVEEMEDPTKARTLRDGTKMQGTETMLPSPVHGWAGDLVAREMRRLRDRALELEEWMDNPRPVRRGRRKVCRTCHRGLFRGANFCGNCGSPTKPPEEKEKEE